MALTLITQGSFTSTGAGVFIPVQQSVDYFRVINQTQWAAAGAGQGVVFEWYGNPSFAIGSALQTTKTSSTNALAASTIASGGFTYYTDFPQPSAPVIGSAITNASPAVVTMTNTFSNGDNVILYNTTGMEIIGGMTFTISSVSGSGYTLLGLPAAGFAAPATNVVARKVAPFAPVLPEFLYVTAISQAAQAVVTVSQDPTNVVYVGQKLEFTVPSSFGMIEINNSNLQFNNINYPAVVTAVNAAAYQFTVNINTTNFTPFAFPASTLSPTAPLFATVAPQGSSTQYNLVTQQYTGYNFNLQPFRTSMDLPSMYLAGGANSPAGSNNDVIVWQAYKMESTFYGPK